MYVHNIYIYIYMYITYNQGRNILPPPLPVAAFLLNML